MTCAKQERPGTHHEAIKVRLLQSSSRVVSFPPPWQSERLGHRVMAQCRVWDHIIRGVRLQRCAPSQAHSSRGCIVGDLRRGELRTCALHERSFRDIAAQCEMGGFPRLLLSPKSSDTSITCVGCGVNLVSSQAKPPEPTPSILG